jgi:ABC-2 type transport system ATP-binding protein
MSVAVPAIETRGLTKRYGAITALDGLDLAVPTGSVFGFLGPNGAGKTTTIKILTSLATATSGAATVGGVPVGHGEPNRRGLIGYLDQAPQFNGWMQGRELLAYVGRLSGLGGRELTDRIAAVLELVGLTDAARRRIGGYSGGMRQRLGIAQAVLTRPPVILLDEPVSALDPEGRRDMLETIRRLAEHSTVLLSSHVLNDVERVCDRVAIIDRGRLVTESGVDELLDRFAQPVYRVEAEPVSAPALGELEAAIGASSWSTGVERDGVLLRVGVGDDPDAGSRLLALVVEHGVRVVSVERLRPSLEDVFLRLTGRGVTDAVTEPSAEGR